METLLVLPDQLGSGSVLSDLVIWASKLETFRGATGTLPPGPTPPAPTQLNSSART